jgi:hypothetical protein
MPLLSLWQSNPTAVGQLTIEQVVATAGDGLLKDGSICSQELRQYLSEVQSDKLGAYIDQCLSSRFDRAGIALQDLVNELGRRLDYKVTNGRYQGTPTAVGFDGLWVSPEGQIVVIEVKTTDAYRISLDTIAGYRSKLADSGMIPGNSSLWLSAAKILVSWRRKFAVPVTRGTFGSSAQKRSSSWSVSRKTLKNKRRAGKSVAF